MKRILALLIALVTVPLAVGCPGNSPMDRKAEADLWTWVQQQDQAGWTISGYENATGYKNIVTDHKLRPAFFDLAINADAVNPLHQRNMLEDIALKWRSLYPANMTPRFNLRVTFYNKTISHATEIGYTEIDKDGTPRTHHGKTQDVM
jgi:hypothetical protein